MLLIILVYNIGTPDIVKRVIIPSLRKQRFLFMLATYVFFSTYGGIAADVVLHMLSKVLTTLKTDHLTNSMSSCELPSTNLTSQ
jgi:hypothetical protein